MSPSFCRTANAFAKACTPGSAPGSGAENGGELLFLQPEIRDRLRGLVQRLCHDPSLHEDVLQEALLCYWRTELARPGQTASWYVQRCASWIRDHLRKGRSVDSLRHSSSTCSIEELGGLDIPSGGDVMQEVYEQDDFDELMHRLDPAEQGTLQLLRAGLGVREIARASHLSHVAVIGRRRHIAATAASLGIHL